MSGATPGCDYGVTGDYQRCAACGTKRPVAALSIRQNGADRQEGAPEDRQSSPDGPACSDLAWCEGQRVRVAVQAERARLVADGYPVWLQVLDMVKRATEVKAKRGRP